ncbi:unnamed protein product [Peniophora sp. CBMAI 1063]|nr:unnamed protein product [Peniophora sp. CBMAI 1063]
MADSVNLSSGQVGSRFVTQNELDDARERREEQWRQAYARLGQEPPPKPTEDAYDGRSLAEKLAANRAAKQEEWEEKNKLANQFRALEEDEIMFLDSVREKQEAAERERKERDGEEVKSFREAVASKVIVKSPPPAPAPAPAAPKTTASAPPAKKPGKTLKGVVVKKKAIKPAATASASAPTAGSPSKDEDAPPDAKRRKIA